MSTPKIDIRNVQKSFGTKRVLENVNLTVEKGQSMVILGGSGSGKSVLLRCLLGLLAPDNGKILVDGVDTTRLNEQQRMQFMRKFGMLFQSGALFDSLSNWENIGFMLTQQGVKPSKVRQTAIDKLALVGLEPRVADQKPAELSGGMRKRVALARAICMEPEIILYDEPTTGLDPITSDVINDLILKLKEDLGVTSVTITHNMNSAFKIADRIAMLYMGKIIANGTVKEIKTSDNPYVTQFVNGLAQGPIKVGQR